MHLGVTDLHFQYADLHMPRCYISPFIGCDPANMTRCYVLPSLVSKQVLVTQRHIYICILVNHTFQITQHILPVISIQYHRHRVSFQS